MELRENIKIIRNKSCMHNPEFLQIVLTEKCNSKCIQCYRSFNNVKDLDYEVIKKLLKEASELGIKKLILIGGDPILYGKYEELSLLITKLGMQQTVSTSGKEIKKLSIDFIKKNKIHFSISLNGSKKEINNLSRDNFELTISAIEYLKNNNIEYSINWVCRKDNVRDFENLISFSRENKASYINIIKNKINNKYYIDSELSYDDLKLISELFKKNRDILKVENCFSQLKNLIGYKSKSPLIKGCGAGRIFCGIDVHGKFIPCTHLNYAESYKGIDEYWKKSEVLSGLRNIVSEDLKYCNECINCSSCLPCRASSIEMCNDFNLGDSKCVCFSNS